MLTVFVKGINSIKFGSKIHFTLKIFASLPDSQHSGLMMVVPTLEMHRILYNEQLLENL